MAFLTQFLQLIMPTSIEIIGNVFEIIGNWIFFNSNYPSLPASELSNYPSLPANELSNNVINTQTINKTAESLASPGMSPAAHKQHLKHSEIHSKIQKQRQEMLLNRQRNFDEFRNQLKMEQEKLQTKEQLAIESTKMAASIRTIRPVYSCETLFLIVSPIFTMIFIDILQILIYCF